MRDTKIKNYNKKRNFRKSNVVTSKKCFIVYRHKVYKRIMQMNSNI